MESPERQSPPPTTTATTTTSTTTHGGADPQTNPSGENNHLISEEISTLQDLALKGSWKTILEKVTKARSLSLLKYPHEHLIYLTFNAIALTKLRRFSEALDDIVSSTSSTKTLDSPAYRYESYPQFYPSRNGSMVPFSLRWLHALLPSLLRSPEALDRLYLLLNFVRSRIESMSIPIVTIQPNYSVTETKELLVWRRRENLVIGTLVSIHSSQKEFGVCLSLLKDMISRDPRNPSLLSKLGYVQLQFGDLEGAKLSFELVEKAVSSSSLVEDKNLVARNKALVYMVAKDYVSAVREYDECVERDAADVVAINNKALCLMYLRDLSDSIKVLENSLERVPTVALNETLVVNLCSMYELAFVNHSDLKKTLSNWIARVAPDDFDSSCTRI